MNLNLTSQQAEVIYDALFEHKIKLKALRVQYEKDPKRIAKWNEVIHEIEAELLPMIESFIE
jgi:hypothetical protein